MAIFGNKTKNNEFTINFSAVEGTPIYSPMNAISVILHETNMEFKPRVGKKESVTLDYSQITNFGRISEEEIITTDKSVVGRAVVGGLILGPLGAIVGAVDGIGTKSKKTYRRFFVINYVSSAGEDQALPLEIVGATMGIDKLEQQLKDRCTNLAIPEPKSNKL